MPVDIATLLKARATIAYDIDATGRVLVGDDQTGSMQLYEITPGGDWTQLTKLDDRCSGRYLPGERTVVVEHDLGGNERGQLSLLRLDDPTAELTPLVHDERFIHNILDTLPGRVVYATNRRNGVDFDVVVREIASGADRVLYDGGGWIMRVAVAPDEAHVVLNRPGGAPNSQQLLLVETRTGQVDELAAFDEPARNGFPQWLPDSTGFVFTTNSGRDFSGVARYELANRSWDYIVTGTDDITGWLAPDGSRLLYSVRNDGADALWIEPNGTGDIPSRPSPVEIPAGSLATWLHAPIWSPGAEFLALTVGNPTEPGDVYVWDGGSVRRITDSSPELDKASFVTPESHRIPTPDGEQIPCFLYRPADGGGSVVLLIHGGPESESVRSWSPVVQALVSAGHTVAVPNVRGSTGYGKRWASLDDVRLRLDSVADLSAVHSWLPSVGLDADRAALYGGSYGGYMVLAGLTMQPELWAAGVDIVGMSSLVTFLENTSSYRRAAREREYGTLAEDRDFLREASPLTHIDAVRAPLLILHGANDPRVPLSEAEQLADAVRSAGVECEMCVYDDEGHGLSKLRNKLDAYPRVIEFLNRQLGRD
ncbi:MAG TPA: S9 family peptidase [Mycobacteriales bacterium]|jgi:dipeptidyl aminopeptidase/acylaminoacyl peptidase|nr:S9 family peptidase [Mycobacteriales bacterium]